MPTINRQALVFSLNSFAASMLALYIAFSIGLPRPYWALITAYLVSQPLAGAVRSKAVFRLAGTLTGAAAAVVLVPSLVNAPLLLSLALALWVAGCLFVALLDRSPRSYVMLLAGYTAAIIGFPSVMQPGAIFDTAVARVEEIGLGIVCAAAVHSLVFPRPVGDALRAQISDWLDSADRWLLDLMQRGDAAESARDRRRLALAATEIRILATHLPFDTSRLRDTSAAVEAMHERMLLLIPLLSSLDDRLRAVADAGGLNDEVQARLDETSAWLQSAARYDDGLPLAAALRETAAAQAGGHWRALLIESLLVQLAEAVTALGESHALLGHLHNPDAPARPGIAVAIADAVRRPLHHDVGRALRSSATMAVAVTVTCAIWIGTGWSAGAGAAMMCAVLCALYAAFDDPAPEIFRFGVCTLVAILVAALYLFAVLPAIDGFAALAAVLFPTLFVAGLFIADRKTAGVAVPFIAMFGGALALQETLVANFADFLNGNLAQLVAVVVAVVVTRAMRSMTLEASVHRLLTQTSTAIAGLARRGSSEDPAAVAARLVDRLAVLTPKLSANPAGGDDIAENALRDLRVAMNLMTVRRGRRALDATGRLQVDGVLSGLAAHYAALASGGPRTAPERLLRPLDAALSTVAGDTDAEARRAALGLVGLRRNLFPAAPPFVAAQEQPA